jgi:hypothetical protein
MSPEERKKEREREREKMPFIVATYVYASSQGQRTHSARTNNGTVTIQYDIYIYTLCTEWARLQL